MTDTIDKEKRSWVMSRVRSTNTKPEKIVRSALHRLGLRFRLHRRDLPGHPDIVFGKRRLAIFVHGCFWHCHPGCAACRVPKSNVEFWEAKLKRNVERDQTTAAALAAMGWRREIIWECEVRAPERLAARLREIFAADPQYADVGDNGTEILAAAETANQYHSATKAATKNYPHAKAQR